MKIVSRIFKEELSDYLFYVSPAVFVRVLAVAAMSGAVMWLLAMGLDRFILTPMVCGNDAPQLLCSDSVMTAGHIASLIVAIMVVPVLIMFGIKRPLVVVAAATAALWGIDFWQGQGPVGLLLAVLSYTVVYAALVWLNRIRGDAAAIVIAVIFVIIARIVLSL